MIVEYAPVFENGWVDGKISSKIVNGKIFTLNCESHENPPANVTWFFSPSKSGNTITNWVDLENKKKTLEYPSMDSSRQGSYMCVVENIVGKSKKYFSVTHLPSSNYLIL